MKILFFVDSFAACCGQKLMPEPESLHLIPIEVMTSSGPRGQREALKSNISVACFLDVETSSLRFN